MRLLRHRLALRATLAAVAGAAVAYGVFQPAGGGARRAAPALPATTLAGRAVTLAQLRGRPALIVFFASWCPGCHQEAPAVERFARSAAARGHVVAVDYDDYGDWRAFLRRYGWTVPVFGDRDGTLGAAYGISGLPATVVLDASGRIVSTSASPQTVASLRSALQKAD
jgi:cytochrome c biogenesis protein CcmG, thiol:disulfide interchange protein DsbE